MKDRYLFPRKIKYTVDVIFPATPCLFGGASVRGNECTDVMVSSWACTNCIYHRGDDEKNHVVLCVRKPKQKKLIEGAL